MSGGRSRIVITELPYQTNKSSLLERIAELARSDRIDAVSDLRDESDRRGMSIVIELKRGAQPETTLNQLFKYTPLQSTFGVQILALVDGEPRLLNLKRALQLFVEHRREVVTRRSQYELEKARQRAHVLEGLKIALDHLDAVIKTIRESPDVDTARERLIERFEFSDVQAQAILDMQLRRLAALERQKIEDEYLELIQRIAYFEDLLASPRKILYLIKEELGGLKQAYADGRRTRLVEEDAELTVEDLVAEEDVLVTITERGYIKCVSAGSYRAHGRGVKGAARDEDAITRMFSARTLDTILFFSNRGKVYEEKVYQIPKMDRVSKGVLLNSILSLAAGERITSAVAVSDFEGSPGTDVPSEAEGREGTVVMFTHQGKVKRVALSEFSNGRRSGLIAIGLGRGDRLGWVDLMRGEEDVIVVTQQGQALRFGGETVRVMGRSAAGVNAIKLDRDDRVCSAGVVEDDAGADLLVVTAKGYCKRTPLGEFAVKGRYGKGVRCLGGEREQTGVISAARVVRSEDEITLISTGGMVLRAAVGDIPQMGRAARGSKVMELKEGDEIRSVAVIGSEE
jgi:DNA gyrase subunit A